MVTDLGAEPENVELSQFMSRFGFGLAEEIVANLYWNSTENIAGFHRNVTFRRYQSD